MKGQGKGERLIKHLSRNNCINQSDFCPLRCGCFCKLCSMGPFITEEQSTFSAPLLTYVLVCNFCSVSHGVGETNRNLCTSLFLRWKQRGGRGEKGEARISANRKKKQMLKRFYEQATNVPACCWVLLQLTSSSECIYSAYLLY